MNNKRWDVCSPRAKREGGVFWHRVGTAWEGEKGINVVFDSLPLPDREGRVSVSLFEPREPLQQQQARPATGKPDLILRRPHATAPQGYADDLDDAIPFEDSMTERRDITDRLRDAATSADFNGEHRLAELLQEAADTIMRLRFPHRDLFGAAGDKQ